MAKNYVYPFPLCALTILFVKRVGLDGKYNGFNGVAYKSD